MYPATSWGCTLRWVKNARVTAGLRCAPLVRPMGLNATRLPVPANNSPVNSNRADILGSKCVTGL